MHPLRTACLALLATAALVAPAAARTRGEGAFTTADMDTTCAPCRDFYQYVNGGWVSRANIPPSYSSLGTGQEVRDRNQDRLHALLDDAVANLSTAAPGSNAWRLGVYYGGAMDSTRIDALGAKPLEPELARIAAIKSPDELTAEVARLHAQGVGVMFRSSAFPDLKNSTQMMAALFQGGLGLPDRDYYTKQDSASQAMRAEYLAHVQRMLELTGGTPEQAKADADKVMAIETALANASLTNVQRRDVTRLYHKMTVAQLDTLAPSFGWKAYFEGAGFPAFTDLNVAMPDFIKALSGMVAATPIEDWKAYLRWQLADDAAPALSAAFVDEDFRFQKLLSGAREQLPRWKRCIQATDMALGDALGAEFVKRYFPPAAKARALEMVGNLEAALKERIAGLEWMSDSTKIQATAKLEAIRNKIGYTEKWRDYSTLALVPDQAYENRAAAFAFERRRNLAKVGKPVDKTEWNMTPPTVNAYYNPTQNEIVFPAGILQPPFFDADADDALNYGAIGSVIGHEITHGFDDQGSRFDATGNLRSWWTAKDDEQFKARTGVVVEQYNNYVAVDTLHVNGKLTLGENIADLGGVAIAYAAFQKSLAGKPRTAIDGFTPEQRFFLGYAREWRGKFRPEYIRLRTLTDPHSPNYWRAIGPLSNLPEFARAFGCKPGDAMVREAQAKIW
jgi:putative endopeptidase